LALHGNINGAHDLRLNVSGASTLASVDLSDGVLPASGDLTLEQGTFTTTGTIDINDLNIISASLDMGTYELSTNGINNAGTLESSGTVNVADASLINSGTLNLSGEVKLGSSLTNTGSLTIGTLTLENSSQDILLSFGGTVNNITTLNVAANRQATLTSGNIQVTNFEFLNGPSSSTFTLGSGTSLEVTGTLRYNDGGLYSGNYFITSGGGELIQTVADSDIEYRVGNSNSAIVVTLRQPVGSSGERIAVGVVDSVKEQGYTISGIEDTVKFTINIDRDSGTTNLYMGVNWAESQEGTGFDTTDASLFDYSGGKWTKDNPVTVNTPSAGRHAITDYELTHNGTYTIANSDADMTSPPNPMNVNIYEMANSHFLPFNGSLDTNIFLAFEIGVYPYFTPDSYVTAENINPLGEITYRQMEYRFVTDPQTNPLYGQVPPIGAETGQAITEQASLTLTGDAPVYVVADGEYSAGEGWLPITEPASVENIEEYQEPITQGQINEFYLEFGGREDIFTRPASFKSDLDEMLDDLLAG
jgi:hypothetical protein